MKQYLRWNPETNTITGEMLVAKEMKHKKEEMKKPAKSLKEKRMEKKEKHMDAKEDMAMLKSKVKKGCMK